MTPFPPSFLPPFPEQLALFLAAVSLPSLALYDKSDDVYELTSDNFDSMVINSEHVWVVEFYAPW